MRMNDVQELTAELHRKCKAKGIRFSRWETNGTGHKIDITYALHTGERKTQFRFMPEDEVISFRYLYAREGKTIRCDAYKQLRQLLKVVELR